MDIEKWKDDQATNKLYQLRNQDSNLDKLLSSGPGNRSINPKMAILAVKLGEVANHLNLSYLKTLVNETVDYQGCINAETNNRLQYIKAVIFKQYAEHEKSRFISQLTPGGK